MAKKDGDTVVIVGSGGREHALAWKLRQSEHVGNIFCLPGNPGMAEVAECVPADITRTDALAQTIIDLQPQLVVVGPEAPLVAGLADQLIAQRVAVFGPTAAAARLEGSKSFAKLLMVRAAVPTATFGVADDMRTAELFIRRVGVRLVVKADGLCDGKGVVVCDSTREALAAAQSMLVDRIHGEQGSRIVIEERLSGREVSVMALVDGTRVVLLPTAQDYKRRHDGDQGPMTGGMGCYSPSPDVPPEQLAWIREFVLLPTVRQMAADSTPFRGLLYAGLMLTHAGPMVLEFNCRFGDPETQVVLPRLADDLYPWLRDCAVGALPAGEFPEDARAAVCVAQCAGSYPLKGSKGAPIDGLEKAATLPDVTVFHAGTARDQAGRIVTNGGRVLGTTAMGGTVAEARARAYEAVSCISWDGEAHRSDIAAGV